MTAAMVAAQNAIGKPAVLLKVRGDGSAQLGTNTPRGRAAHYLRSAHNAGMRIALRLTPTMRIYEGFWERTPDYSPEFRLSVPCTASPARHGAWRATSRTSSARTFDANQVLP